MSGKRVKRERRAMEEMAAALKPLAPIADEAFLQLEKEGSEMFAKWLSIALGIHEIKPDLPLTKLLPNQLDQTMREVGAEIERLLASEQIEDRP